MWDRIHRRGRSRRACSSLLLALTAWGAHAGSARAAGTALAAAIQPRSAPRVEVAFVLDTTGSMSGLIEGAKRKIWSIANQLASGQPRPKVSIALIAYRDRGDTYVTRVHELTDDIDGVYAHLQQLRRGRRRRYARVGNQALHEAVSRARVVERPERLPRDLPGRRRAAAPRLSGRRGVSTTASRARASAAS